MSTGKPRVILQKCRTVFFDLEFYVPESMRDQQGFLYNPWDKKSKFIGGCFYAANPAYDYAKQDQQLRNKTKSFWIWEHDGEADLLRAIADYLIEVCELVRKPHKGTVSPILCGINITSSDIPILFDLFKRFKILTNKESFELQNKFRVIDLSSLSISAFNNSSYFLYPNTKNSMMNKYLNGNVFEDGRSVWGLYDQSDYKGIESRVLDEVVSSIKLYKALKDDFDKFKTLEKSHIKRERQALKDAAG